MMKAEKSIVKLNQNQIKNKLLLGANTTILPDAVVNNDAIIGAGSVVIIEVNKKINRYWCSCKRNKKLRDENFAFISIEGKKI